MMTIRGRSVKLPLTQESFEELLDVLRTADFKACLRDAVAAAEGVLDLSFHYDRSSSNTIQGDILLGEGNFLVVQPVGVQLHVWEIRDDRSHSALSAIEALLDAGKWWDLSLDCGTQLYVRRLCWAAPREPDPQPVAPPSESPLSDDAIRTVSRLTGLRQEILSHCVHEISRRVGAVPPSC